MEILEYAKRGLKECNTILNDPEQKINHDYWKGKRVVFNSVLQILNESLNKVVEDGQAGDCQDFDCPDYLPCLQTSFMACYKPPAG
ncbi:hypothetical protein H8E88_27895 [candidate division KSB1 bacterium]|nr:hypothetical protein [candidate division KSB1 bacterium]